MRTSFSVLLVALFLGLPLLGQARIMDITDVEGVRSNQIRGIGLIMGLNGTGDRSILTRQMTANLLKRSGINIPAGGLPPDNMAVVMVTASIPPFARPGSRIDITASSMGDAESLRGGQLISTQLVGYDNRTVYALAEGSIATGGVSVTGGTGSREVINHPTVGRIPGGAYIEKGIPQKPIGPRGKIRLLLREPSFKTAQNMVGVVNKAFPNTARALDASTVELTPPPKNARMIVPFLSAIGELRVPVVTKARIILSERNGTIVVGEDVVVLPVAITHSNLSISVRESFNVSQPQPLSEGETKVTPETDIKISESGTPMQVIPQSVSAGELARALNTLGLSPLDLITIFQMLKTQGALQAELVIQ